MLMASHHRLVGRPTANPTVFKSSGRGTEDALMQGTLDRATFGPYRLVRRLDHELGRERWLALHERDGTAHVVYRVETRRDGGSRRRFIEAVRGVARLYHPHLLPIQSVSFDDRGRDGGRGCIVGPFIGTPDGLVTLERLREAKGGRLGVSEVRHALAQMLSAVEYAHSRGVVHGAHDASRVLLDRSGKVQLELYGLERALLRADAASSAGLVREEVASIARLGYLLLTGTRALVLPGAQNAAPSAAIGAEGAVWDAWMSRALDPLEGFASAGAALAALPQIGRRRQAEDAARERKRLQNAARPLGLAPRTRRPVSVTTRARLAIRVLLAGVRGVRTARATRTA
jgi:serine/threonine protein kinase